MARTNLREVLEAIGASPKGLANEKDAVALLDLHLNRVQRCQHTDELLDLVIVRDGARKALSTTAELAKTSVVTHSHAEPLDNALKPLERLIARLEKEESDGAPKDEKGMAGLLSKELGLVQALQHTDDMEDLARASIRAKRLLALSEALQQTSPLVRSHAEQLEKALGPVDRLVANMQKELVPKESNAPKTGKEPVQPIAKSEPQQPLPKVEPKVEKVPSIPDNLPPAQKSVREALQGGNLKDKVAEPEFERVTKEWMAKADPSDPEQRKDMLAVLKAIDPSKRAERQKAFEQTFNTKVQSEERNYELMTTLDRSTKPPTKVPKLDKFGKPQYFEGKPKSTPLDPRAIEMMADIMGQLPAEHMPKGWVLEGQDKPTDPSTHGSYNDATDMAALTFSLKDVSDGGKFKYSGNCAPGDPLHDADAFDLLIRHECGHKAGLSLKSRSLTSQAGAGGWIDHGDLDMVLGALSTEWTEFVTLVQGSHGAPAESVIKAAVKQAEEAQFDPSAVEEALKLPGRVPAESALLKILRQAVGAGNPAPYILGSSPASSGDRIYLVGGPDHSWFSFSKAAWQKRVSYYQYATPEEWFAEFYASANNKEKSIRDAAKQRYPDAWGWMKDRGCIVFPE